MTSRVVLHRSVGERGERQVRELYEKPRMPRQWSRRGAARRDFLGARPPPWAARRTVPGCASQRRGNEATPFSVQVDMCLSL